MKKRFRIENLECANCAAKMEDKISKLEGVDNVSINFMTSKMILDGNEDIMPQIIKDSERIINKIEPGTKLKRA